MKLPDSIVNIVEEATQCNPDDIEAAAEVAEAKIRMLPEFDVLVTALVSKAIIEAVYECRTQLNGFIKRGAGTTTTATGTKVNGVSPSINRLAVTWMNYMIGRRTLGDLTGEELEELAEQEGALADGHRVNVRFLRAIRERVSDENKVRDVLTESELQKIRDRAEGKKPAAQKKAKPMKAAARTTV